jgi:hypothetical protein
MASFVGIVLGLVGGGVWLGAEWRGVGEGEFVVEGEGEGQGDEGKREEELKS